MSVGLAPAELRSGEAVERAVALDFRRGAQAILFNGSARRRRSSTVGAFRKICRIDSLSIIRIATASLGA